MQDNRFRKDLFFRLGTTIHVPPLREHLEDIPALVEHFLGRLSVEYRPPFDACRRRRWSACRRTPGPATCANCAPSWKTAVATTEGDVISLRDLHLLDEQPSVAAGSGRRASNLEELEAWAIRQALAQTGGNNTQAAGCWASTATRLSPR